MSGGDGGGERRLQGLALRGEDGEAWRHFEEIGGDFDRVCVFRDVCGQERGGTGEEGGGGMGTWIVGFQWGLSAEGQRWGWAFWGEWGRDGVKGKWGEGGMCGHVWEEFRTGKG